MCLLWPAQNNLVPGYASAAKTVKRLRIHSEDFPTFGFKLSELSSDSLNTMRVKSGVFVGAQG